jgi:hypothetical protein
MTLMEVSTVGMHKWQQLKHKHYKIKLWTVWAAKELKLRNNSTVFEELEVSIVDLMAANAVSLATQSGASKMDICDRQIHNWHWQHFKYSTVIPILMKFSQRVHTSLKTYKWRNICTFQILSAKKIVM